MIDNDEARKTWNELTRVAARPLARAVETEAYFEQFAGDVPDRAEIYANDPGYDLKALYDPIFVCDPSSHIWYNWIGMRGNLGTYAGKRCINCGLIEW